MSWENEVNECSASDYFPFPVRSNQSTFCSKHYYRSCRAHHAITGVKKKERQIKFPKYSIQSVPWELTDSQAKIMNAMNTWQSPTSSVTSDITFISIWLKPTATRAAKEKLVSLGTLPFLFDQNHSNSQREGANHFKPDGRIIQRCAREKGLSISQLTGIIHLLLTDTHLKERRNKRVGRENIK